MDVLYFRTKYNNKEQGKNSFKTTIDWMVETGKYNYSFNLLIFTYF